MFALPKWLTDIKKLFATADGKVLGRAAGAWGFTPASQTAAAGSIPVTANTTGDLPLINGAALLWGDGTARIAGDGETDLITLTGSLGIGTTPVNKLDIEGAIAIGAAYSGTRTAPTNGMIVEGRAIFGGYADDAVSQVQVNGVQYINGRLSVNVVGNTTHAIAVSQGDVSLFKGTNTAASASTAGAGFQFYSDDGAAMAAGDRLGFLTFGGAKDNTHLMISGAVINGYAAENWTPTAQGTYISILTTSIGTTGAAKTAKLIVNADGTITVGDSALPASMKGGLHVKLGTDPTDSVENTFQLYGMDLVAGHTIPAFRTEAGHIVKLYSQALVSDAKIDYTTGDLDTEAEIISALNTTNGKINSILTILKNNGSMLTS
jgi:hypothetical protein